MKPLIRYALSGGLVIALLAVLVNCRVAMYPVARAFGSPPESELAACRDAFAQLQTHLATGRLTVAPVLFVEDRARGWRTDLARALAGEVAAGSPAHPAIAAAAPDVSPPLMGHNQLRYLWDRSREYARWIPAARPPADFVCCAEIWSHAGQVTAIHVFVYDAKGQLAYCRLFNSHHFGSTLSADSPDPIKLLVRHLLKDLQGDAQTIFPPYGIG